MSLWLFPEQWGNALLYGNGLAGRIAVPVTNNYAEVYGEISHGY